MINFFGVNFHLYGLIIGLAVLGALQASIKYGKSLGLKKDHVEKMALWVVGGGVIGARVYHVVHLWSEVYSLDPISSLYVWNGGLGIWGGILGGFLGLVVFVWQGKVSKDKFLRLLDVAAIGMPLGQAIGRLGNWTNGELYGKNGEPLFAFEAGLNLVLFVVLWKMGMKKMVTGKVVGVYLIGYGLIRMLLENFRPEVVIWKWQEVPVAVIMGMVSVVVGGIIYQKRRS